LKIKLYFFIESQVKFKELKKRLEKELSQKADLETQMKQLQTENESFKKKVIIFLFIHILNYSYFIESQSEIADLKKSSKEELAKQQTSGTQTENKVIFFFY
jgi:glucose-6-phosphate-specific signal transduction histidine kinase